MLWPGNAWILRMCCQLRVPLLSWLLHAAPTWEQGCICTCPGMLTDACVDDPSQSLGTHGWEMCTTLCVANFSKQAVEAEVLSSTMKQRFLEWVATSSYCFGLWTWNVRKTWQWKLRITNCSSRMSCDGCYGMTNADWLISVLAVQTLPALLRESG